MTEIIVGARASRLSQAQTQEVLKELKLHNPSVLFKPLFIESYGDKDLNRSLRTLEKTDFFTREIDELLVTGACRIAIHSAKDLPEPIPQGLKIIALTIGVDPSDSLVFRENETLHSLPPGAIVATSSIRREEAVRKLRHDLQFIDLRGTIEQRLLKLETGEADAVVVAEAALIRLGLTHLNRIKLPGPAVPYQGQLAVMARENDIEMQALFRCLDTRPQKKRVLYLGLEVPNVFLEEEVIHYPVIRIEPRSIADAQIQRSFVALKEFTHLLFTSKSAVRIFCDYALLMGLQMDALLNKSVIAVGQSTAKELAQHGLQAHFIASEESSEGIVQMLSDVSLGNAYIFWPHSALSRSVLQDFFDEKQIRYHACVVYDTLLQAPRPIPELALIDEIVFSSPSTVDGFVQIYGSLPKGKRLTAIGPVTRSYLKGKL